MKNKIHYLLCILLLTTNNQYTNDETIKNNPDEITQKNNADNAAYNYVKALVAVNIATPILALIGVYTGKCSLFAGIFGTDSI